MNMALCIIICFRETASPDTWGGYGAIQSLAQSVQTVNTVILLIRIGHGTPVDMVSITYLIHNQPTHILVSQ